MTTDLLGSIVEHDGERGRVRCVTHHSTESNRLVLWVQSDAGDLTPVDARQARIVEVVQ